MIRDVRTLGLAEPDEADLCIIGAGAAGIAIAREFISSPCRVIVLESGGFRREPSVQQLYQAASVGERYYQKLDACRSRYFGGSTNCWCGICRPLDPIDFEERPWIPWSGWPVTYDELVPYFARAHALCSPAPYMYEESAWEAIGLDPDRFDRSMFHPLVWHCNSRAPYALSFGKRFRRELQRAPNIEVLLHASVTELLTSRNGSVVKRAVIRSVDGTVRHVRARNFILASGGIENARILLASKSGHRDGLGNEHGLVGRFFHEHLQAPCGILVAPEAAGEASRYSRLLRFGGSCFQPGLGLSTVAQSSERTPNAAFSIDPVFDQESAIVALQRVRSDIRHQHIGLDTVKRFCRASVELGQWGPAVWTRFVRKDRPAGHPRKFLVYARSEQVPNPESRVALSTETDALGMPRAILDWHTTPLDRTGIRLIASFAASEFRRLGIGEFLQADWVNGAAWPEYLLGGPHHMGTTRMSENSDTGVVDRNCKVHGLDGLYVAGSSVFPTGGHANPTLSILTFALRLADHLRESFSLTLMPKPIDVTALRSHAATPAD